MIETRPNNNSNGEIPKGQIVSAYDHLVQLKGSFQDAPFLDVQQNLYKLLFTPLSERSYDQPMSIKRENVNFFLTHIGLNPQKTTDAWDKSHSSKTWGTNDGIAEQLARALDVTTIEPEKDTTTTTIKAEQTSQGIIFDVSYADMKGKFFLTPPKEYLVQTKIYTS